MSYYAGLDIGGTKTEVLLMDSDGKVLSDEQSGAGNINSVGLAAATDNIVKGIEKALSAAGRTPQDCAGVSVGAAGVSVDGVSRQIEQILRSAGFVCPMHIGSDIDPIVEYYGDNHLAIIAGTGSYVAGRRGNLKLKAGGYGYLLGDEGSGIDIARRAIRSVLLQWDIEQARSPLADELCAYFGVEHPGQLPNAIYKGKFTNNQIAKASFSVYNQYCKGCALSEQVIRHAAEGLLVYVMAVADKLWTASDSFGVVLCGGVFCHNEALRQFVVQKLAACYPFSNIALQQHSAAHYAALCAAKL